MNRICTICARGGSKGVKNKNVREIAGKPLIAHSIEQAKRSGLFKVIAVSSNSKEILAIAKQWGADVIVKRPDELASDFAPKIPAMHHCVRETEKVLEEIFDVIVDIDATSPLRIVEDIVNAVDMLEKNNVSNVITGSPSRRSPYFNLIEECDRGNVELSKKLPNAVVRRQDAPKTYDMNASIYVWNRKSFFECETVFLEDTKLYVMPEERSVDIDSELDFKIVEMLLIERDQK